MLNVERIRYFLNAFSAFEPAFTSAIGRRSAGKCHVCSLAVASAASVSWRCLVIHPSLRRRTAGDLALQIATAKIYRLAIRRNEKIVWNVAET